MHVNTRSGERPQGMQLGLLGLTLQTKSRDPDPASNAWTGHSDQGFGDWVPTRIGSDPFSDYESSPSVCLLPSLSVRRLKTSFTSGRGVGGVGGGCFSSLKVGPFWSSRPMPVGP